MVRRTPDCIIIHAGTNDVTRETDTINNLRSIVRDAKETAPTTEIVISSLATRYDKANINQKVVQLNKEIDDLAKDININVITHPNLDKCCRNKKLLHLNRRGVAELAKNFLGFIASNF